MKNRVENEVNNQADSRADDKVVSKRRKQLVVLVCGIGFLAAGLMQGGYEDTLRKAIMICLECIGSG